MKPKNKKPPHRLREREGGSRLTAPSVSPPVTERKPFDEVEKKLSLTLDALLDAIGAYREGQR